MNTQNGQIVSTTNGMLSLEDQEKIRNTSVAITGGRSLGGLLAERLVRIGIGKLKIMDLDFFKESNKTKSTGPEVNTLGDKESSWIYNEIKGIIWPKIPRLPLYKRQINFLKMKNYLYFCEFYTTILNILRKLHYLSFHFFKILVKTIKSRKIKTRKEAIVCLN